MSIINKKLQADPEYMEKARKLYNEGCIPLAKETLKKWVSTGRRADGAVRSYDVIKIP
jgi:hypothetical protein